MIEMSEERYERIKFAIHKYEKWSGIDVGELVEEGYLEEGDLD